MDEKELKETNIWTLYNKHVDFLRKHGEYETVDKCNRFYNGDQWDQLIIEGVSPIQYNFIKPIVNYKVTKITKNLRAINFGAENIESTEFRHKAKQICDLFNQRAARVWENDQMDDKCKKLVRQAAINSESILYTYYDKKENNPKNEILNKLDVFYGNENEPDIQKQPYILAKKRLSLLEAKEFATEFDAKEKDIDLITGDEDTTDEAGESAKDEVNNSVTVLTKFYKVKGIVKFDISTRYSDICKSKNLGTKRYPFSHMLWSEKEGSARGEGEVRTLIPNQIETNKNALRRLIATKNTAYPQKAYLKDKISNPDAIFSVGGVIEVNGGETVDDVNKVFSTIKPSQMSPDAEKLQQELISTTRELASASDTATGQVNPENASGRAILAVQQASEQPLDDQNVALNTMLEDVARTWIEMWKVNNKEGIKLENVIVDPRTGDEVVDVVEIDANSLEQLKASVKIDITPKGSFDKYAQEVSLENLASSQQFMNTAWLEDYASLLDNDAVMPKLKIEDLIKKRKAQQERIRQIQQMGNILQSHVNQLMDTGQILPKEMMNYEQQPIA